MSYPGPYAREASQVEIPGDEIILETMDAVVVAWLVLIVGCCFVLLIYMFRTHVPGFLSDLFQWGKTKKQMKRSRSQTFLEVPNSWFTHFYLAGIIWTLVLVWFLVDTCHTGGRGITFMHYLISPSSASDVPCSSVLITLALLFLQVTRRFLECLFVSVFTGRIHMTHYLVGMTFYLLTGLSISAPLLARNTLQGWCYTCSDIPSTWLHFHWPHYIGCATFLWASWHQYKCHVILAKLRSLNTNHSSQVRVYKIPYGDWFKYVSSPHYLAEILIYTSFAILQMGYNSYTWFMLVFVVLNLSLGASVTQQWYQEKFEHYPQSRCRIFPFVY